MGEPTQALLPCQALKPRSGRRVPAVVGAEQVRRNGRRGREGGIGESFREVRGQLPPDVPERSPVSRVDGEEIPDTLFGSIGKVCARAVARAGRAPATRIPGGPSHACWRGRAREPSFRAIRRDRRLHALNRPLCEDPPGIRFASSQEETQGGAHLSRRGVQRAGRPQGMVPVRIGRSPVAMIEVREQGARPLRVEVVRGRHADAIEEALLHVVFEPLAGQLLDDGCGDGRPRIGIREERAGAPP